MTRANDTSKCKRGSRRSCYRARHLVVNMISSTSTSSSSAASAVRLQFAALTGYRGRATGAAQRRPGLLGATLLCGPRTLRRGGYGVRYHGAAVPVRRSLTRAALGLPPNRGWTGCPADADGKIVRFCFGYHALGHVFLHPRLRWRLEGPVAALSCVQSAVNARTDPAVEASG